MPTAEQTQAKDEVDRFVKRFKNDDYRLLACYAALPLVLTPELVHFLRNQFLRGTVPWVAEADFLLSELCQEVGYEQFAMRLPVREYLIGEMRERLGEPQMEKAARLILDYARHLGRTHVIDKQELAAQQWSAMLYLADQRGSAIRQIAENWSALVTAAPSGQARIDKDALAHLARIMEMLAPQLSTCPELVRDAEEFTVLLAGQETGPRQNAITVEGISLPAPMDVVHPPPKPGVPPPAPKWEFDAVLFLSETDASWGQQIMAYLLGRGLNVLQQVWERSRGEAPEMVLERIAPRHQVDRRGRRKPRTGHVECTADATGSGTINGREACDSGPVAWGVLGFAGHTAGVIFRRFTRRPDGRGPQAPRGGDPRARS